MRTKMRSAGIVTTAGGTMLFLAAAGASALEIPSAAAAPAAQAEADPAKKTEFFLELRGRAEYLDNFNDKYYGAAPKSGDSSDSFLLSRVRVGLARQFNEQFSGKASLQDSRVFGWGFDDADWANSEFGGIVSNPQEDPLELGETWLRYQNGGLTAQAGRQLIGCGNSRILAASDWKNSGKWIWDAVKARYQSGGHWAEAFYGRTMLHDPDLFSLDHRHGYDGAGLHGHVQLAESLAAEPVLATKHNDRSLDYQKKDLLYYGARLLFEQNGFTADSTYVRQTGSVTKEAEADVDAQGFNLDLDYAFNPQWSVGATFSYASGDDKSTADNERFDGMYGASDKYYGLINLMVWSNLLDYGLTAEYRPAKNITLRGEAHQFYADEISDKWLSYKNGLSSSSEQYGSELDLKVTWKVNPAWTLLAAASVFLPGDAIEEAAAGGQEFLTDDTACSGFLQAAYKFSTEF
ncbi:alginate export family protein [Candidatus Electronema sp. JC]|uniref:alginate export family protein n=1 Tax=Candidatus Electronema sp. JC TaxID=3401570 RepID=UPI003B43058A